MVAEVGGVPLRARTHVPSKPPMRSMSRRGARVMTANVLHPANVEALTKRFTRKWWTASIQTAWGQSAPDWMKSKPGDARQDLRRESERIIRAAILRAADDLRRRQGNGVYPRRLCHRGRPKRLAQAAQCRGSNG
jgi:hypothetical protein